MSKIWKYVLGLLFVLSVIVGFVLLQGRDYIFNGTVYESPEQAPAIDLPYGGDEFHLSDQKGKIVLLFFGYTSCPDICPTTLSEMKRLTAELGDDAEKTQVVFITVDPERDTPDKLASYTALFNPSFIGLTGELDQLEPIWRDYGVFWERVDDTNSAAGYLINHSSRLYLINQQGDLHLTYSFGTPMEDILSDVQYLLDGWNEEG